MNKRQLLYLPVILIISVSCKSGNKPIISTVKADTTDVWVPDNNDGTYKNPVIYADYSDPDVIRRGDDYYLISSSFNCVPGIPILHSGDLVNWKIAGHVMNRLQPDDYFSIPRQGQGVWAPSFKVTCKIVQYLKHENDKAGLIIMGSDYAYIAVTKKKAQLLIEQGICLNADKNSPENRQETQVPDSSVIYFRCVVSDNAVCEFYYSLDGKNFVPFGSAFTAKPGRWIGAKNGLFCTGNTKTNDVGYIDVDWFRIEKL